MIAWEITQAALNLSKVLDGTKVLYISRDENGKVESVRVVDKTR